MHHRHTGRVQDHGYADEKRSFGEVFPGTYPAADTRKITPRTTTYGDMHAPPAVAKYELGRVPYGLVELTIWAQETLRKEAIGFGIHLRIVHTRPRIPSEDQRLVLHAFATIIPTRCSGTERSPWG